MLHQKLEVSVKPGDSWKNEKFGITSTSTSSVFRGDGGSGGRWVVGVNGWFSQNSSGRFLFLKEFFKNWGPKIRGVENLLSISIQNAVFWHSNGEGIRFIILGED